MKLDLWRIRDQCCITKIELGTELHKRVENENKEGEHRHGGRCAFLKIQSVVKSFPLRQKPELEKGFTTAGITNNTRYERSCYLSFEEG